MVKKSLKTRTYIASTCLITAVSAFACKQRTSSVVKDENGTASGSVNAGGQLNLCAAVRGNGNYIFTHFGSMSRIVEDYGEVDAMAGGSSGSVTAFLYESIVMNKGLTKDKGPQRNQEIALLIKSLMGLIDAAENTSQAQAIGGLVTAATALKGASSVTTKRVAGAANQLSAPSAAKMTANDYAKLASQLKIVLTDPTLKSLVSPVVLAMLENTDQIEYPTLPPYHDHAFKVREVIAAAQVVGQFNAADPSVFFREGVLNYAGLARILADVGNFYAGADATSAQLLQKFIDGCTQFSAGKTWTELANLQGEGANCKSLLNEALVDFWTRKDNGSLKIADADDRLSQDVGANMPAFLPSAVLATPAAIQDFQDNLRRYRANDPKKPVKIGVDFDDVRFGYFVPEDYITLLPQKFLSDFASDAKVIEQNAKHSPKSIVLNSSAVKWSYVLEHSPQEPGLSRIQVAEDGQIAYIGGWGDLMPVQVLRAAGCTNVIDINRKGPETPFITQSRSLADPNATPRKGLAELLNMTAEQQTALYMPTNPNSSYNMAVATADAVWCTDWDSAQANQIDFMFDHSYGRTESVNGWNTQIARNTSKGKSFFAKSGVPILEGSMVGCAP